MQITLWKVFVAKQKNKRVAVGAGIKFCLFFKLKIGDLFVDINTPPKILYVVRNSMEITVKHQLQNQSGSEHYWFCHSLVVEPGDKLINFHKHQYSDLYNGDDNTCNVFLLLS